MELLLLGAGAVLVVLAGGFAVGFVRRGRDHRRWQLALNEAARRLPSARTSPGTRFDGPELRSEVEGYTVSVRVRPGRRPEVEGAAYASVALGPDAPHSRVWLGWDAGEPPADSRHLPELAIEAQRVDGRILALGDDAAFAQRTLDGVYLDLLDVRREARAHAVVLTVRGGYLELQFFGIQVSAHLLERLTRASARIAAALPRFAAATALEGGDGGPKRPLVDGGQA